MNSLIAWLTCSGDILESFSAQAPGQPRQTQIIDSNDGGWKINKKIKDLYKCCFPKRSASKDDVSKMRERINKLYLMKTTKTPETPGQVPCRKVPAISKTKSAMAAASPKLKGELKGPKMMSKANPVAKSEGLTAYVGPSQSSSIISFDGQTQSENDFNAMIKSAYRIQIKDGVQPCSICRALFTRLPNEFRGNANPSHIHLLLKEGDEIMWKEVICIYKHHHEEGSGPQLYNAACKLAQREIVRCKKSGKATSS